MHEIIDLLKQVAVPASWLAIPVGLWCAIDSWLLAPRRATDAGTLTVPDPPLVRIAYAVLPWLVVAVILRPAAMLLAFVARALAEDRPLWAYTLRPAVTLAVGIAAVWYRLRMLLNAATSKSVRQRWRQLRWRARQRSEGSDPGQTPERDDSRH